jgi:transcriptional regulator with XRE-family HTH domain
MSTRTATKSLSALGLRKQELGLTNDQLAARAGVSSATVKRVLSGSDSASFAHVAAIAEALGMTLQLQPKCDVGTMRQQQASAKAKQLAELTYANSSLEGQGVGTKTLDAVTRQLAIRLLREKRNLWAD